MRRRAPHGAAAGDDPTGLAGWLYADLLLGLAVVFLGSLTFVVVRGSGDGDAAEVAPTSSTATATTTTTHHDHSTTTTTVPAATVPPESVPPAPPAACSVDRHQLPRIQVALGDDDTTLVAEVRAVVPEATPIGFALLFGGGRDGGADDRAAGLAERLRLLMGGEFGSAVMRPFHDQNLQPGLVQPRSLPAGRRLLSRRHTSEDH